MIMPATASRPAISSQGEPSLVGEQRDQCAEQRDQRKGAQSGFGGGIALAFQADQQADGETGQELRQGFDAVVQQEMDSR